MHPITLGKCRTIGYPKPLRTNAPTEPGLYVRSLPNDAAHKRTASRHFRLNPEPISNLHILKGKAGTHCPFLLS